MDFIIYHSMRINAGKMNVNDLFFFKHCRITHKYVLLCGSKPWALLRAHFVFFEYQWRVPYYYCDSNETIYSFELGYLTLYEPKNNT